MSLFRRLAVASTLATLVLVTIGGLVRATKSGLGCGTDWPHCSGKLLPALESRALVIELSHRVAAAVVVILLAALALAAWRLHRTRRRLLWASTGAFALVLFQALLGAVVVKLELEAASVVLHLATAMALLGVLVYVTASAYRAQDKLAAAPDPVVARRASLAAGSVLVLLMIGSYVSGMPGAGLAFDDWPLMNGRLIPDTSMAPAAIHFLHRVAAALAAVVVGVVGAGVLRRGGQLPLQARLARVALGAFALEVLIGAANVWTALNPLLVTAHLLVGAIIWAGLVGIAVLSRPAPVETIAERSARAREPVLETGR
jgi:heme A synthase